MRTYEMVCAFRMKEGMDEAGVAAVKAILGEASIQSEKDMGDRELAYEINKEDRARYRLFNVKLDPVNLPKIEESLKLRREILRYLFVGK